MTVVAPVGYAVFQCPYRSVGATLVGLVGSHRMKGMRFVHTRVGSFPGGPLRVVASATSVLLQWHHAMHLDSGSRIRHHQMLGPCASRPWVKQVPHYFRVCRMYGKLTSTYQAQQLRGSVAVPTSEPRGGVASFQRATLPLLGLRNRK